jgi:hypothetical protein
VTSTASAEEARGPIGSIALSSPPRWSLSIDGYGGLGVLAMAESRQDSHPLAGAMARGRFRSFELGGYASVAPMTVDFAWAAGGLAGVWLPFHRWIDLEAALAGGARHYANPERDFGPGGYSFYVPTAGLRFGFSARTEGTVGARVGAMLIMDADLRIRRMAWSREPDPTNPIGERGRRAVGGVDVVLAITVGLDARGSSEVDERSR